jgi:hypothetical protein
VTEKNSLGRPLPEIPEGWEPYQGTLNGVLVQGFVHKGTAGSVQQKDVFEIIDGELVPVEGPVKDLIVIEHYHLMGDMVEIFKRALLDGPEETRPSADTDESGQ